MPTTAHATPAHTRGATRSRKNSQLSTATAAGMAARMTPAETALVSLTPVIMHTVKRKLPRNDSRNSKRRVRGVNGGSLAGFFSQCSMATPPMPKRNQASKSTGKISASGLDSAT